MAQNDFAIPNQGGQAFRLDVQDALQSLAGHSSGATDPNTAVGTTYPYQFWADTNNSVMKMRNGADSAWIELFQLDGEWSTIAFENGTAAAPSIYFKDSGTDTGFYSPGADQVGISTGGTSALVVDASQRVGIGTTTVEDSTGSSTRLQIQATNGGADVALRIKNNSTTTDTTSSIRFTNTTSTFDHASIVAGRSPNAYLALKTNDGNTALYIDSAQRVGIGTTSPGSYDASANTLVVGNTSSKNGISIVSATNQPGSLFFADGTSGADAYRCYLQYNHGNNGLEIGVNGSAALNIDSSGRLLVGTPSAIDTNSKLQIESDTNDKIVLKGTSAVANNGSNINWYVGSTYKAAIYGGNDASSSSVLTFSTTAGGGSSPTERMRIANDGAFNSYTSSNEGFSVRTSAGAGTGSYIYQGFRSASSTTTGTVVYRVYSNGTYATISDQAQKKNIETTRDGYLEDLNKLRVVKYHWNEQEDVDSKELGLIAQEVESIFPGLIDSTFSDSGESIKGVKVSVLPFMLIKALQEATARIESLEAEVAALKGA